MFAVRSSPLNAYHVYGLTLHSEMALPYLDDAPPGVAPDVTLRVGEELAEFTRTEGCVEASVGTLLYHQPGAGSLRVTGGREIVVHPRADGDRTMLQNLVVSQGLSAILHQRSFFLLHAGSVALHDHALAFVGNKGWGKSSTTTALLKRGHPFVTDDVLAVRTDADEPAAVPLVHPGFRQVKLWPDAVEAVLGEVAEDLPSVYGGTTKLAWHAEGPMAQHPLPLGIVYVLGIGPRPAAIPLTPRDSVVSLLRHAYTGQIARATGRAPDLLRQCSSVAHCVPIFRLERPADLSALDCFVAFIEEHAAQTLAR